MSRLLLYETGNTPTFARLLEEGSDVVGCDLCREVVDYKTSVYGRDGLFALEGIPPRMKFDGIVAVEVFQHFRDLPWSFARIAGLLAEGGVICGTTDFHPGGPIEEETEPAYMRTLSYVAYWSPRAIELAARREGLKTSLFELIRPGSVLPDEKYGKLWLNKRVFFIYDGDMHGEFFEALKQSTPVLPIDQP